MGLIYRLLTDPEITKEMIIRVNKVTSAVFKQQLIPSPRQASLNPLWIDIETVINLCNLIFPDIEGLSLQCVDWIR